jgi:hypothetical protein
MILTDVYTARSFGDRSVPTTSPSPRSITSSNAAGWWTSKARAE